MQVFYVPDIAVRPELPEEEAAHALRVLRLGEGSPIVATDGKGFFYKALISSAGRKQCTLNVTERWEQPLTWPFYLHLAVAPTKNLDRMEWLCEKATEIGVNAITFLNCRYSERRELKTARIEKILVSAMKQSQQATLPTLAGMTDFHSFISRPFEGQKFIAHCGTGERLLLKTAYLPGSHALILIGPEGDFSTEEVCRALGEGFAPVSLGDSRLRTETAALAACHTLHVLT
jgi:16S rRNA (uracil1498-N3)-methyltransferase